MHALGAMAMSLIALTSASPAPAGLATSAAAQTGQGTWYGESCGEEPCWQKGPCAFVDYVLPSGIDGSTCVSETIWDNAYHCGGCVSITYQGKKKIAMITNKTGGNAQHLDMSPDMFSQLADKSLGEIGIQWEHVPCPIASPLQVRMHGGASQYWFAATVENAVYRTAKMEVSSDQGVTWKPTTRDVNNFFKLEGNGGTGSATAWVRVTSETGSQVVLKDVQMKSETTTKAGENYA
ncbi:uncharacterized protein PG998_005048 [Apiospora kogelbergensis]|uniref:Expansin-like EG45 domain-containing protein n=1 Tax=Apiospora kogelbergensis TaxID=1337665 RepID=A0AAW0QIY2_9PEZI